MEGCEEAPVDKVPEVLDDDDGVIELVTMLLMLRVDNPLVPDVVPVLLLAEVGLED